MILHDYHLQPNQEDTRMTEEGTTNTPTAPSAHEQSRTFRFQIGDRVAMTHDEHDNLSVNAEGTVESFENAELTYLGVKFDDGSTEVLTEDDLRHLPPV
jgi:hypothetical protein